MTSEQPETDRDRLLQRLVALLGSARYRRVDVRNYSVLHLEAPRGADYEFSVWVYDDGEPQIAARLMAGTEDQSFWDRHFELPDYSSNESRNTAFLEILERVTTCRTRITQTKGWLLWGFCCYAEVAGEWLSVGGQAAGRWIRGIPDTAQKRAEYFSPAIR